MEIDMKRLSFRQRVELELLMTDSIKAVFGIFLLCIFYWMFF